VLRRTGPIVVGSCRRIDGSFQRLSAGYVKATNSWRFILRDSVWSLADVKDITAQVTKAQKWEGA
jgi:hypothetical protein